MFSTACTGQVRCGSASCSCPSHHPIRHLSRRESEGVESIDHRLLPAVSKNFLPSLNISLEITQELILHELMLLEDGLSAFLAPLEDELDILCFSSCMKARYLTSTSSWSSHNWMKSLRYHHTRLPQRSPYQLLSLRRRRERKNNT